MKRFVLAAFASLLFASPSFAGVQGYQICDNSNHCATVTNGKIDANLTISADIPLGHNWGLAVASATGISPPALATKAIISIEGQPIRYSDDGTNPTASTGVLLPVGITIYTGDLTAVRFIQTAPTATLNINFY